MILRKDKHSKYFLTNRHEQVGYEFDENSDFVDFYSDKLSFNFECWLEIMKFSLWIESFKKELFLKDILYYETSH